MNSKVIHDYQIVNQEFIDDLVGEMIYGDKNFSFIHIEVNDVNEPIRDYVLLTLKKNRDKFLMKDFLINLSNDRY